MDNGQEKRGAEWVALSSLTPEEIEKLRWWHKAYNRSGFVAEIGMRAFLIAALGAVVGLIFLGDSVRGAGLKLSGLMATIWGVAGFVRLTAFEKINEVYDAKVRRS